MKPTSFFSKVYHHPLLTESDYEKIAEAHEPETFYQNDFLLKKGKTANQYYVLESGVVRAFVHDIDGNEITTEFFTANDIVIIPSSLFQRIPSSENLQCVTECVLWKIDFEKFQQLFHELEGFREWGRAWFSQQVFSMKQRSLDMITKSAAERYLSFMEAKPDVLKNVPLKQIASYLGITDTSLSRIRKEIFK